MNIFENILTHGSTVDNLKDILRDRKIGSHYRVSLSKYPRWSFDGGSFMPEGYIAFDKKKLEDHLAKGAKPSKPEHVGSSLVSRRGWEDKRLTRPIYVDQFEKGETTVINPESKTQRKVRTSSWKEMQGAKRHNYFASYPVEEPAFKAERELSTTPFNFELDHVKHLGHHTVIYDPERPRGVGQDSDRVNEIVKMANLAHNVSKPLKLSIQLHSKHPSYENFLKTGTSSEIERFKGFLGEHLPGWVGEKASRELLSSMKISLGHNDDTKHLSRKDLHPELRRSAVEESEMSKADHLIQEKLTGLKKVVGVAAMGATLSSGCTAASKVGDSAVGLVRDVASVPAAFFRGAVGDPAAQGEIQAFRDSRGIHPTEDPFQKTYSGFAQAQKTLYPFLTPRQNARIQQINKDFNKARVLKDRAQNFIDRQEFYRRYRNNIRK